jgi:hypothetical protein
MSWLALFAVATSASAGTPTVFNAQSDWLASYPTTASALAATHATWGTQAVDPNAWSAGVMSWNWTNQQGNTGTPFSIQTFGSYYTPNTTGVETSGGTVKATFTYTVPWTAYQLNPGSSFQQAVGTTFTEQVASGFKPEKAGGADAGAITLPSGFTSGGATTGVLNEVGVARANTSTTTAVGFTTTAYNVSNSFNDGDGSVRATVAGIFYNYNTTANAVSSSLGGLNFADAAQTHALSISDNFGPAYVAWTAPASGGSVTISLTASDLNNADDGTPGIYAVTSIGGPSSPLMSATNESGSGVVNPTPYTSPTDSTGGTVSITSPGTTTLGATSGSFTGVTQLTWTSGTVAVSGGETIYFVVDPGHDQYATHGNHSTGGGTNNTALAVSVTFVPEPSSFVLLGLAGVGLAVVARKRRRTA